MNVWNWLALMFIFDIESQFLLDRLSMRDHVLVCMYVCVRTYARECALLIVKYQMLAFSIGLCVNGWNNDMCHINQTIVSL